MCAHGEKNRKKEGAPRDDAANKLHLWYPNEKKMELVWMHAAHRALLAGAPTPFVVLPPSQIKMVETPLPLFLRTPTHKRKQMNQKNEAPVFSLQTFLCKEFFGGS